MWIMTTYGILMPAALPETSRPEYDGRWNPAWDMQVRARDRDALIRVRKEMLDRGGAVPPSRIQYTAGRDYEFRMYVDRLAFAAVMAHQITEIDYVKFKPNAVTAKLHNVYTHIWYVVAKAYDSAVLGGDRVGRRSKTR